MLAAGRALSAIDLHSVTRDPMLRWMIVLTPALGLLLRYMLPPAAAAIERRFGFDLILYYGLIMSFLPVVVAGMTGTVVGFLMLDQRDDETLRALLVTPLSLGGYLGYRLLAVMLICMAFSCVAVLLAGLTRTTLLQLLVVSIVAAPLAPIYALFLGSAAENKVQGFALAKALGIVIVPCVAAYFVTGPEQIAFGLIPHYWALKTYWLFDTGAPGQALFHAFVGLAWQGLLLALLWRWFADILRR